MSLLLNLFVWSIKILFHNVVANFVSVYNYIILDIDYKLHVYPRPEPEGQKAVDVTVSALHCVPQKMHPS